MLKPEYYRGGDYIYKNLELSLGREVWRLDLSPLHISLGRLFLTCLHCQGRKHAGTPKSVHMKLEASCELSNTEWWLGPSHDDPLEVPSQSAPALPKNTTGTAVYCLGCHHCAVPYHTWLFKDGSFLGVWRKLCWRKAQSSSDIVQDPTRVSRTVCVWLNVSTTPGKGAYMHRSAQKWLFTGCWSDLNIGSEAGRAVP